MNQAMLDVFMTAACWSGVTLFLFAGFAAFSVAMVWLLEFICKRLRCAALVAQYIWHRKKFKQWLAEKERERQCQKS